MVDRRDVASNVHRPYKVDEKRGVITLSIPIEADCERCKGTGNADSSGVGALADPTYQGDCLYCEGSGYIVSEEIEVPLEWEVCPTCRGKGSHVNPGIDAHGITSQEMWELGPEFEQDYFSGTYDVPCNECHGKRVVPTSSDPQFQEALEDMWRDAYDDAQTRYYESGGY